MEQKHTKWFWIGVVCAIIAFVLMVFTGRADPDSIIGRLGFRVDFFITISFGWFSVICFLQHFHELDQRETHRRLLEGGDVRAWEEEWGKDPEAEGAWQKFNQELLDEYLAKRKELLDEYPPKRDPMTTIAILHANMREKRLRYAQEWGDRLRYGFVNRLRESTSQTSSELSR